MRILLTGILACASVVLVENSSAAPPQPPPPIPAATPEIGQPPVLNLKQVEKVGRNNRVQEAEFAGMILVPRFEPTPEHDKEIAGLSRASRPVVLNWERIYAMALGRARSARESPPAAADPPATTTKEAARPVSADFDRFRNDFFAELPGSTATFRDPSAAVFQLLARLQTIDNVRRNIETHENLVKFIGERIQGEGSGLQQLDVDMMFDSLMRARRRRTDEIGRYRDELDELKMLLGLSPRVAVILERPNPEPFRLVRDSVDRWTRMPDRSLAELPRIMEGLPDLGEIIVGDEPILAKVAKDPDLLEEILTNAAHIAIKNRSERDKTQLQGDAAAQLEIRVRRRLRRLLEMRHAYDAEKRRYDLAIRLQDQTFERLVSPPAGPIASRSPLLTGLIERVNQVTEVEDRMVGLWTSFRAERLAVYRDLGVLPYRDWSSFYADLSPTPVANAAAAVEPQPKAGNAPPPPAPPRPPN